MKNILSPLIFLFTTALCIFFSSCHRPVAYFQRTPRALAARLPVDHTIVKTTPEVDSLVASKQVLPVVQPPAAPAVVSTRNHPATAEPTSARVERRMQRIQSLLPTSTTTQDKQPDPKPKKKLKLGNQIRQSLGMKLRPELNWWQRISWKLKASILVILIAVVFAILHITILAIIFGILGAFLMISGLKRSFKVKRPWF